MCTYLVKWLHFKVHFNLQYLDQNVLEIENQVANFYLRWLKIELNQ